MRPTWKAATIVDPFAKVSGSTLAWWLVVALALHVAWVNGSVSIVVGPVTADAPPAGARTPPTTAATATPESAAVLLARRAELLMVPPGGWGCPVAPPQSAIDRTQSGVARQSFGRRMDRLCPIAQP